MNNEPIYPNPRPRSFILRLIVDAHGELRGQISEPGSTEANGDEWRTTFVGMNHLWATLLERWGLCSTTSIHPGSTEEKE